jgi:hypothetical protein
MRITVVRALFEIGANAAAPVMAERASAKERFIFVGIVVDLFGFM